MAKFRTAFEEKRVRFNSPEGSREFPVFQEDEKGELNEIGKTNVYEKIQSYKDECLLDNIIKRCSETGETLIAPKEQFFDTTVLPKDRLEVENKVSEVKSFVASLSKEDQAALFEKGFDQFIADKIKESAAKVQPTPAPKSEEVSDNE